MQPKVETISYHLTEKKKKFSEKLEKLYIAIEAIEIFIKLFFIVKGSIENIEVKTENQKHKELLYLTGRQNCVLQKKKCEKECNY